MDNASDYYGPLVRIGKREARKRWENGQHVGVTNDEYEDGWRGSAPSNPRMRARFDTFDKFAEMSIDTRRPSCLHFWAPAPDEPAPGTVWAVTMVNGKDRTVTLFSSEEWALVSVDIYVREWWESAGTGYPMPDDPGRARYHYFDQAAEEYTITAHVVDGEQV